MTKKTLGILIVTIAIIASGNLTAAHTLAIGSVNYYDYATLEAGDFDNELHQGIRIEYFFNDNLGISADSIIIKENDWHQEKVSVYFLDAILRLPLDPLEPYIGIGPTYRSSMDHHDTEIEQLAYNVRFGVDFIALGWLSVGIESNFLVDDVPDFFNTLSHSSASEIAEAVQDQSLIGLTAKVTF